MSLPPVLRVGYDCTHRGLATILITIVGAGAVITQGVTVHTVLILVVMMITSFIGTAIWTKVGSRIAVQQNAGSSL